MSVPELTTERRLIVKGWKVEDGKRREFVSHSPLYDPNWVEHERARIGEQGLPDWQPHITEVIVQERQVTEWHTVVEIAAYTQKGNDDLSDWSKSATARLVTDEPWQKGGDERA